MYYLTKTDSSRKGMYCAYFYVHIFMSWTRVALLDSL